MKLNENFKVSLFILAFFGLPFLLAAWLDSASCYAKYEQEYSPVTWGVLQGCKATFNGKHIPVERIREQAQ